MPEISVIVPVYKVEKYIDRCVESILAQSFENFELILVDDGSPDNCGKMCDEYAARDERVTVIHKKNGGLSDARNAGIDWAFANSDSRYLAFIDSDDYLHPDYLRVLYDTAVQNGANLAICDFERVDEADAPISEEYIFNTLITENKSELFEYLYANWRIRPAWNKLYAKDIFKNLRFKFGKIHEDEFAIHHVLYNCRKAAITDSKLYYYRCRANSIVANESPKTRLDGFEAIIDQSEFCLKHGLPLFDYVFSSDYLTVTAGIQNMDKPNIKRCKKLKRRYKRLHLRFKVRNFFDLCRKKLWGNE